MDIEISIPNDPPPPYPFNRMRNFKNVKFFWYITAIILCALLIGIGAFIVYCRSPKFESFRYDSVYVEPELEPIIIADTRYIYDITAIDEEGNRMTTILETSERDPKIRSMEAELLRQQTEESLKRKARARKFTGQMENICGQIGKGIDDEVNSYMK